MKLLLDTHIWLWSLLEPDRLSERVAHELQAPTNELWLSPLSTWELLLLVEKGRVVLNVELAAWLRMAFRTAPFKEALLSQEIVLATRTLDLPHRDPVDAFLAATAAVHQLTLVTADDRLLGSRRYPTLANA